MLIKISGCFHEHVLKKILVGAYLSIICEDYKKQIRNFNLTTQSSIILSFMFLVNYVSRLNILNPR